MERSGSRITVVMRAIKLQTSFGLRIQKTPSDQSDVLAVMPEVCFLSHCPTMYLSKGYNRGCSKPAVSGRYTACLEQRFRFKRFQFSVVILVKSRGKT